MNLFSCLNVHSKQQLFPTVTQLDSLIKIIKIQLLQDDESFQQMFDFRNQNIRQQSIVICLSTSKFRSQRKFTSKTTMEIH